jgi:hypothetical protein
VSFDADQMLTTKAGASRPALSACALGNDLLLLINP